MARIEVPDGDAPEIERVWALRPEMGKAVAKLADAVYNKSELPGRVREAARMRIAQINECPICLAWRIPALADEGVDEELYAHVHEAPRWDGYSDRERLAVEYAERYALDHRAIGDDFFARLRAHFTDAEILDLTICIANFLAFGRLTEVLRLDQACAVVPVSAG
jgi:AhpD family alkylhydroperoxidase